MLSACIFFGTMLIISVSEIYTSENSHQKPNIIIFLADDMGINDVSYHGSNQFGTYNIDALAYNGIILNSFYASSACTPSRSALMTSKFPIFTGMHHGVILEGEPWGLPKKYKILPEYLKELGYTTAICGKWHLGFHRKEYTPTSRGFDYHYGYWNGYQDYYDHYVRETYGTMRGYDMRDGMDPDWNAHGKYSTDYFTEKGIGVINKQDKNNPLFLLMSHLAPHSGSPEGDLKAPQETMAQFSYINNSNRRSLAAVMSKLDQSVGDVITALHNRKMLDNSIVIFMSDNGAPTFGMHNNFGSNFPLRSIKSTEWEGGVRTTAVIWSPLLKKQQRVSNMLMNIVDLMPTLYSAAGGNVADMGNIDGIDMWEALSNAMSENLRLEMPHNIDTPENSLGISGAIRVEDWKYISGVAYGGVIDNWYGDTGQPSVANETGYGYDPRKALMSQVGIAISQVNANRWKTHKFDTSLENEVFLEDDDGLTIEKITSLRQAATIKCTTVKENEGVEKCKPIASPCLINIKYDPCEKYNLAKIFPQQFQYMKNKFAEYKKKVVKPLNKVVDHKADPRYYNNTWSTWMDLTTPQFNGAKERFSLRKLRNGSLGLWYSFRHLLQYIPSLKPNERV